MITPLKTRGGWLFLIQNFSSKNILIVSSSYLSRKNRIEKTKMFRIYRHCVLLILAFSVVHTIKASYTSEETDEKTKSVYSAVTSISDSTDTSRHHRVRTFNGSPCMHSGCKFNNEPNMVAVSNPCSSSTGCSFPQQGHNSYVNSGGYPVGHSYTNNGNGGQIAKGYNQPEANIYRTSMPIYQPPQHSFNQHINPAPYPYWNGNHNHHNQDHQGSRGHSVHDHSLRVNSEYTEAGTHTGSFQQPSPGYGYGSGYSSGYNGLFNRPVF